MLAGWKESHTSGATVTFWLPDSGDLDIFRGMTARKGNVAGQRFMCVLVEIGSGEEPVRSSPPSEAAGPLCKWAVLRCKEAAFWEWMTEALGAEVVDEPGAREALLQVCCIGSRRDLDRDPRAAEMFHALIRRPYQSWCEHRGVSGE